MVIAMFYWCTSTGSGEVFFNEFSKFPLQNHDWKIYSSNCQEELKYNFILQTYD